MNPSNNDALAIAMVEVEPGVEGMGLLSVRGVTLLRHRIRVGDLVANPSTRCASTARAVMLSRHRRLSRTSIPEPDFALARTGWSYPRLLRWTQG